jgi:O-succinylbenzoic acid--CoA ligase
MDLQTFLAEWHNDSPRILVHTSGSTGQPKPLWVEKRRMEASARITCQFLGLHSGDTALLCMPLDYIAGKMMVVRALTCGLQLITVEPSGHPLSPSMSQQSTASPIDFAAMVPLQVYNSLQVPEERERLMHIRHLIIGGGAIDAVLAQQLKDFPHAVWSTYGMTETLSHIALRRLSGPEASQWYTPFPSVSLTLSSDGCLIVNAPQVCDAPLTTNDLAEIRPDGRFRILGRKDNVICSGGLKIIAEEVEQLLKPHLSSPFLITKRKDPKFGEAVVLLTEGSTDEAEQACRQWLPRHWQPRHYLHVDRIPLTATGKPARRSAQEMASDLLQLLQCCSSQKGI